MMHTCPVCGWPLHSLSELKTHLEIKHKGVRYLTIEPSGSDFKMGNLHSYPEGDWDQIGGFWRASDDQQFVVLGKGIYAGEVDMDELSAAISDFLGLGKRVL